MNSRMKKKCETLPRGYKAIPFTPPDAIHGTTKVRTYAGKTLCSKETTLPKMLKRARLCSRGKQEK